MDVSHTQMPCHADLLHTEISTHRRFSTQKFGTLMFLHNETCFHTGAFPHSSWYRQKSCTHTATCTNRKFLNTEISPIDVSTRRHFAQRHFCTQQLLHPDILLHRCFCPLQDFTCKKNVFTDKCVHSQKLLTQKWKQRAAEKVAMVQVVYISLGYACVFFSGDPVQRSHRFSQKIFCRGLSRRSCAYIYRVLAKRPFPEIPETDPSNPQTDPLNRSCTNPKTNC